MFGRLLPTSLVRPRSQLRTRIYADAAYCEALDDEAIRDAWDKVKNYVNTLRYQHGFTGMRLAIDKAVSPGSDSWCNGAPGWIRDSLDLLGGLEDPRMLIGRSLDEISDRLQLGSVRLIVLVLYIETAWIRPVNLSLLADPAGDAPDPELDSVSWDLSEVEARAAALMTLAKSDLPTLDDLRFGKRLAAVCRVGQTTREALEDLAQGRSRADRHDQALLVDGLSKALQMTARDEIAEIGAWAVLRRFDEEHRARNLEIYGGRFGLLGHGGSELEAIGQRYGMTRERVRQIVKKMLGAAAAQPIWAPATIKAHLGYHARLPARREALEKDPQMRALLGPNLSLSELERFTSTFLGRDQKAGALGNRRVVAKRVREVMVTGTKQQKIATAVHRWTLKTVSHVGAAQAEWIASKATKETGKAVTDDDVKALLQGAEDFEWLHEETGWFWLKDAARNRLANQILRMVCVRPEPLPIDIVFGGLIRSDRDRRWSQGKEYATGSVVIPPALVIRALCERLPFVYVNGQGHISASKECPAPKEALGHVHFEILQAMLKLRGIARRSEVREHVLGACDIKKVTFEVMFGDAPFISTIGRELFAMRGFELDPERLQEARKAIDDNRKRTNLRPGDESAGPTHGSLVWSLRITEGVMKNYIISVPAALQRTVLPGLYQTTGIVSGEIEVVTRSGEADRSQQLRIKGLAGALRSLVKPGDALILGFDVNQRTLSIGRS